MLATDYGLILVLRSLIKSTKAENLEIQKNPTHQEKKPKKNQMSTFKILK